MEQNVEDSRLRSLNSMNRAVFRVINKSFFQISIFWIGYDGEEIRYRSLPPGDAAVFSTYITHPWIFRDEASKEYLSFKCDQPSITLPCSKIFYPQHIPLNLYIYNPLMTLEDLSLRTILINLKYFQQHIPNGFSFPLPIQNKIESFRQRYRQNSILTNACEHRALCFNNQ